MLQILDLPKNDFKWLQKALDKKDFRECLKQIVVKDGYALATNGHVCFKVKCEDVEGTYDWDGNKVENPGNHPLQNRDMFKGFDTQAVLEVIPRQTNTYRLQGLDIGVNKGYFDCAIDKAKFITLKLAESEDRVLVEYGNRNAVIMGCKLIDIKSGE